VEADKSKSQAPVGSQTSRKRLRADTDDGSLNDGRSCSDEAENPRVDQLKGVPDGQPGSNEELERVDTRKPREGVATRRSIVVKLRTS
jgi:hypothetical protein